MVWRDCHLRLVDYRGVLWSEYPNVNPMPEEQKGREHMSALLVCAMLRFVSGTTQLISDASPRSPGTGHWHEQTWTSLPLQGIARAPKLFG